MNRKLVSELLGISEKSYYRWKEERKIFDFIQKYLDDNLIQEFLETGKISRFDDNNLIYNNFINKNYIKYFNKEKRNRKVSESWEVFVQFYFNFLIHISNIDETHKNLGFSKIIFEFCFAYQNNYKLSQEAEGIFKDMRYFEGWDDEMLIFLKYILKDDLLPLLRGYEYFDEATYHVIKYNIYKYKPELNEEQHSDFFYAINQELIQIKKQSDVIEKITQFVQDLKNS